MPAGGIALLKALPSRGWPATPRPCARAERSDNVHLYPAGSWGPSCADAFVERDGGRWRTFH